MSGANLNVDARRDSFASLEHGLDIKYMSEIYLDTTSIINRNSPNFSLASTLNAFTPSPLFPSTRTSTADSPMSISQTRTESCGYFNGKNEDFNIKAPLLSSQDINVKQEHLAHQSHPQIYSEAILNQKHHKNEISKSLKMFAMLASYKYGNDSSGRESPVCDIMDDFYCNGYVTDDSNSFEEENTLKGTSHLESQYSCNKLFCNDISSQYNWSFNNANYETYNKGVMNPSTNKNKVSVKHYFDPNLWMMRLTAPSQYYNSGVTAESQQIHTSTTLVADTGTAATAVAAANIAYNSQNLKKSQKRFGGAKLDKFSAVKHCVFCENNNEPEAVVKSHAVRDSLGRVLCPKLRTYICPICRASGDKAHTVKYCPQKPIITMEDAVRAESLRLSKNLYFKQGMKV
ncbi:protein nanos [Zeugodacus cucurbitae]|uniref:Protein nanos n=1 Tax=Zeugodacus cucurbitae TaxID=28588 RepID=A0A0A1XR30_ZEUCU|nr:protein nanos [Zeugodacus cucurbitae]